MASVPTSPVDSQKKAPQLLRIFLPENHTTLLQVADDMTMGNILAVVCQKRLIEPSLHSLVVIMDGQELEALPGDKYGLYIQAAEVRLKLKSDIKRRSNNLPDGPSTSSMNRRRSSVQMNAPRPEIKMGVEIPVSIIEDGTKTIGARRTSRAITSISNFLKKGDKSANNSSNSLAGPASPEDAGPRSVSPLASNYTEASLSDFNPPSQSDESPEVFKTASRDSVSTLSNNVDTESVHSDDAAPASPVMATKVQFVRKRVDSVGVKNATLKRHQFRSRSISEQNPNIRELVLTRESTDFVLLRIQIDENDYVTMKFSVASMMGEVLRQITDSNSLDYDEYTIQLPDGTKCDMDRTLQYYQQASRIGEVRVYKGVKSYSSMSVVENGEDVLVLAVANSEQTVMAGTPEKLIERATSDAEKDMKFVDNFLMTFRSFTDPVYVFDELISRFNAVLPADPTDEDVEFYNRTKGLTQHRVVHILKWWTTHQWHDFAWNNGLKTDLEDFVDVLASIPEFNRISLDLSVIIESQVQREAELADLHKSIDSKKKTMESMFESVEVEDLAQQICVHNFELFRNIHPIEFLNQIWRKKDFTAEWSTPNLDFFSSRFDRESYWVATEILSQKDIKKRLNYMKRFIQLGRECQTYQNFFSMFSIFVGLNLTPVQRLKKTWEQVPPKFKQMYDELEKSCDPSKNMKAYRELLLASKGPILPFLPIYLKDLTFMNDGNPSKFKNMVNFDKLRMMANRVKDITDLSKTPYEFKPIPPVQNYLHKPHVEMNLAKLKEESLKCEAKE
eukprot:Partr_v1_DN28751_c1_g1_i4_m63180 putative Son of sevenless homolog